MPFYLDDQSYRLQGFPRNLSKLWTSAASSTAMPATTESTRSQGIENLFLVKETQNLSLHDFLPGYNRYCARQPLSGNPAIARRRTPQIQPTIRPTPPMVKTRSPRSKVAKKSFQGILWWKPLGRPLPLITTLCSRDLSSAKHFDWRRTAR